MELRPGGQGIQTELAKEIDPRSAAPPPWEKQTKLFYEKVPVIRYGNLFGLRADRGPP